MIENKKILCVITARKGSRGMPGKNYKKLLGKPLFMWSVFAAMESKYIDQVAISSNCEECHKAYDKWYREESPFVLDGYSDTIDSSNMRLHWVQRPDEMSGALSKNEDALIHAYKEELYFQFDADIIINLQPTSPVRLDNLIDRTIEAYHEGEHDSLLTANKKTPYIWQKMKDKWEYIDRYFSIDHMKKSYQSKERWQMVKGFDDCCNRKMRQDLKEQEFLFHDNGNVYITDAKVLLRTECRIGDKPCVFEVDDFNSLQIDTEFDFRLIETMLKMKGIDSPIGDTNG